MAKLLGSHKVGNRVERYWRHTGQDGKNKITVETIEDVEPSFNRAKNLSQQRYSDMEYVASIPATLIDEASKINAGRWGVSVRQAYAEIVSNKTDRAKKVWNLLTKGRDFSKLQGRSYR